MVVNHAWNNTSLQTTRNNKVNIANDLRPGLSEKIDHAEAKIIVVAAKLFAGLANAFASSKDSEYSDFGINSRTQAAMGERRVGLAAKTARCQCNQHAYDTEVAQSRSPKAEGTSAGSLTALKSPPRKEADKAKAPKYKSSFAHYAANKDKGMAREADDGRKLREHRNLRPNDEELKKIKSSLADISKQRLLFSPKLTSFIQRRLIPPIKYNSSSNVLSTTL